MEQLIKLFRFYNIYGLRRAVIKSFGRLRFNVPIAVLINPFSIWKKKDFIMIGCGQFAYSAIGFFITKNKGLRFKYCVDVDPKKSLSFAKAFLVPYPINSNQIDKINFKDITLAYIASNHASHTQYASLFLERGIDVYIEKPISVNRVQLAQLRRVYEKTSAKLYFGYNRPFSAAITQLKENMSCSSFTLTCTIIGHFIPADHWYRDPEEGTRVCGNLGHWIDLAMHLLLYKNKIHNLIINIAYADPKTIDDNISLNITTDTNDLITIVLTSREEPFEGINETIVFQQEGLFAKIDDFRKAEFQRNTKKSIKKYWPKDVGHEKAIMQPFLGIQRDVEEVFLSTELMLHIMEMVKNGEVQSMYSLPGQENIIHTGVL